MWSSFMCQSFINIIYCISIIKFFFKKKISYANLMHNLLSFHYILMVCCVTQNVSVVQYFLLRITIKVFFVVVVVGSHLAHFSSRLAKMCIKKFLYKLCKYFHLYSRHGIHISTCKQENILHFILFWLDISEEWETFWEATEHRRGVFHVYKLFYFANFVAVLLAYYYSIHSFSFALFLCYSTRVDMLGE